MTDWVTASQLVAIELDSLERAALSARASHTVAVEWFGRRIAVRFDHPGAAATFAKRYVAFLTSAQPELTVSAVTDAGPDGEPLFWSEPGDAYRHPRRLRGDEVIAFLVDAVVHRAFFDLHAELLSFHAAAVRVGDTAAAVSAVSTGGKSTTAIACARRGMDLYSDERCVLKDGMVQPYPRAINLRSGGLELLASEEVPGDGGIGRILRARNGQEWLAASFAELFGGRPAPAPARLEALFFIDGRDGVASVRPLRLEDAIVRLLSAGLGGPPPGLDRIAAAAALCSHTRAYTLRLGTPDDTALVIAATTRRARPLVAV